MVTRNEIYASIEGRQILIAGQKILPTGRPKRLLDSDEIVYPLKVSRNGTSSIEEEYNPRQARFKESSLLEVGDSIAGPEIWGFSSNFISRNSPNVGGEGRTSRHTGQELTISGVCFMELIQGWIGNAVDVHPRDALLQR
jgi:hypothetical protein